MEIAHDQEHDLLKYMIKFSSQNSHPLCISQPPVTTGPGIQCLLLAFVGTYIHLVCESTDTSCSQPGGCDPNDPFTFSHQKTQKSRKMAIIKFMVGGVHNMRNYIKGSQHWEA